MKDHWNDEYILRLVKQAADTSSDHWEECERWFPLGFSNVIMDDWRAVREVIGDAKGHHFAKAVNGFAELSERQRNIFNALVKNGNDEGEMIEEIFGNKRSWEIRRLEQILTLKKNDETDTYNIPEYLYDELIGNQIALIYLLAKLKLAKEIYNQGDPRFGFITFLLYDYCNGYKKHVEEQLSEDEWTINGFLKIKIKNNEERLSQLLNLKKSIKDNTYEAPEDLFSHLTGIKLALIYLVTKLKEAKEEYGRNDPRNQYASSLLEQFYDNIA